MAVHTDLLAGAQLVRGFYPQPYRHGLLFSRKNIAPNEPLVGLALPGDRVFLCRRNGCWINNVQFQNPNDPAYVQLAVRVANVEKQYWIRPTDFRFKGASSLRLSKATNPEVADAADLATVREHFHLISELVDRASTTDVACSQFFPEDIGFCHKNSSPT